MSLIWIFKLRWGRLVTSPQGFAQVTIIRVKVNNLNVMVFGCITIRLYWCYIGCQWNVCVVKLDFFVTVCGCCSYLSFCQCHHDWMSLIWIISGFYFCLPEISKIYEIRHLTRMRWSIPSVPAGTHTKTANRKRYVHPGHRVGYCIALYWQISDSDFQQSSSST